MKVKVSKKFATFMNNTFMKFNLPYHADFVTMSQTKYSWCVDSDLCENSQDMDFDDDGNNIFKVIRVRYPEEYYATPMYLTTKRLNEEFRRNGVKTVEQLELLIKDMVEI